MCGSSSTTSTRGIIVLSPFFHVAVTTLRSNQIQGVERMTTKKLGRVALALVGATALAALVAAVHASAQDQNTSQAPAPFMGRGRGGPMGPGGPMGMMPMLPHELQLTA